MTHIPTATMNDAARALANVLLPIVAGGVIARRPHMMGIAERLDLDTRAVKEMRRLRHRYGPGPIQITKGRRMVLLLDPADVHRVLDGSPEPFAPDTREKRGALGHFQPEGVLVSTPEERLRRRPFNEEALQTRKPVHEHGDQMARVIREETTALLGHVDFARELDWEAFAIMWWRIVRRIVLGDSARDDEATTADLKRLRKDANWSYLKPTRGSRQRRLLARLERYVERAEPGSLAEMVARTPAKPGTQPHHQLPQWLFAFDAGAWATFRTLALLLNAPEAKSRIHAEFDENPDLPYARACILESLRLWPTTPLILRETTEQTTWSNGELAKGSSVAIFTPFFHRDEENFGEAHRFAPEVWLRERTAQDWPLVPFSGGPAMCPGRNVVLLTASAVLSQLINERDYAGPELGEPIPSSLSPFHLRFRLSATPEET